MADEDFTLKTFLGDMVRCFTCLVLAVSVLADVVWIGVAAYRALHGEVSWWWVAAPILLVLTFVGVMGWLFSRGE